MAYVTSKLYLQKKKREDAKTRRIVAIKKKIEEMGKNRKKKQMSKLGLDSGVVDRDKVLATSA